MSDLTQPGNIRRSRLRRIKNALVVVHDAFGSAAALVLAVALIEQPRALFAYFWHVAPVAALVALVSVGALAAVGVFSSLWRLASLIDFFAIFKSSLSGWEEHAITWAVTTSVNRQRVVVTASTSNPASVSVVLIASRDKAVGICSLSHE